MHRLSAPQLLWGKGRFELVGTATVVRECRRDNFGQVVEVPAYWTPPVMVTSAEMAEGARALIGLGAREGKMGSGPKSIPGGPVRFPFIIIFLCFSDFLFSHLYLNSNTV
jgi:hypothetical protein